MPGDLNDQFAEMLREFDVDGDGILEQFKIFRPRRDFKLIL